MITSSALRILAAIMLLIEAGICAYGAASCVWVLRPAGKRGALREVIDLRTALACAVPGAGLAVIAVILLMWPI